MKTNTARRPPNLLSHFTVFLLASQTACLGTVDSGDPPESIAEAGGALYGLGDNGTAWPGGVVPVCWQNGVGDHPDLQAKIKWILRDTWETVANITFVGWENCSPTDNQVAIRFAPASRGGTFGGYGQGRLAVELLDFDDVTAPGRPSNFRYEVIHEFGHALGFAHEQQRPDNFNNDGTPKQCPPKVATDSQYQRLDGGTYYTSSYDANSIMNYCAREPGTTSPFVQNLSAGDVAGVQAAYGTVPLSASKAIAERGILWRQAQTGAVGIWLLDSAGNILSQAFPQPSGEGVGNEWQIQGRGQFDNDRMGDILWRNLNTGLVAIWFMSGGSLKQQAFPGVVDSSWQIAATADFDHDGLTDILWRNKDGSTAIWFMNAAGAIRTQAWPGRVDNSWVIQGTGDFNHDGIPDILWRNKDGSTAIWFMYAAGTIWTQAWPGRVDNAWTIQGTGDFDKDGFADILWRHTDGTTAIWLMNGGTIQRQTRPLQVDASWQIRGTGDLDGDGTTDILWHNTSGQVVIWFIDRGWIRTQGFPDVLAAYPWRIEGMLRDTQRL